MTPEQLVAWFKATIVPKVPVLRLRELTVHLPAEQKACDETPLTMTSVKTKIDKFSEVWFNSSCKEITKAGCDVAFDKVQAQIEAELQSCTTMANSSVSGSAAKPTDCLDIAEQKLASVAKARTACYAISAMVGPPYESAQTYCAKNYPGPVEHAICLKVTDEVAGDVCGWVYPSHKDYDWSSAGRGKGRTVSGKSCTFSVTGSVQVVEIYGSADAVVIALDSPSEIASASAKALGETPGQTSGLTVLAPGSALFLRHLYSLVQGVAGAVDEVNFAEFDSTTTPLSVDQLRRVWQRRMAVAAFHDAVVAPAAGLPRLGDLANEELFGLLAPVVRRYLVTKDSPLVPVVAQQIATPEHVVEKIDSVATLWYGSGPPSSPTDAYHVHGWPTVVNATKQTRSAQAFGHYHYLVTVVTPLGAESLKGFGGYFPIGVWDVNPMATYIEASAARLAYAWLSPQPHTTAVAPVPLAPGTSAVVRGALWWLVEQVSPVGGGISWSSPATARGKACMPFEGRALAGLAEMLGFKHLCDGQQWYAAAQALLRVQNVAAYGLKAWAVGFDVQAVPVQAVTTPSHDSIAVSPTKLVEMITPWRWEFDQGVVCLAMPIAGRVLQGATAHQSGLAWCRDPLLAGFDAAAWVAASAGIDAGMTQAAVVAAMQVAPIIAAYGPSLQERLLGFLATGTMRFAALPNIWGASKATTMAGAVVAGTKSWAFAQPSVGASVSAQMAWAMRFTQLAAIARNTGVRALPSDFTADFLGVQSLHWKGVSTLIMQAAPWKRGDPPWKWVLDADAQVVAEGWKVAYEAAKAHAVKKGEIPTESNVQSKLNELGLDSTYITYILIPEPSPVPSAIAAVAMADLAKFAEMVKSV